MKVVKLYEEEQGDEGTRKGEYEKVTRTKVNNEGVADKVTSLVVRPDIQMNSIFCDSKTKIRIASCHT